VLLVAALMPCVANADLRTIRDPNDVAGRLDIRSARHGHSGARVTHSVTTFGTFLSRSLRRDGFTFQIDTNANHRTFERFVAVFWANGALRARVASRNSDLGAAAVSRRNGRTVRIVVRKDLLGSPLGYRWLVASFFGPSGFDVAPNRRLVLHDLTRPTINLLSFSDPTTNQSATTTFQVRFRVFDRGGAGLRRWFLQRRLLGATAWTTIRSGPTGGLKTLSIAGVQGRTYQFRVVAGDRRGNRTISPIRRISVPFDDANPRFNYSVDWTEGASTGAFLGNEHVASTGTFTETFDGSFVAWIATSGTGTANVQIDGGATAPVNLGATSGSRRVVFQQGGLSPGPHTLEITVQSGTVSIDGLVFR
jgi:hypothetical protein